MNTDYHDLTALLARALESTPTSAAMTATAVDSVLTEYALFVAHINEVLGQYQDLRDQGLDLDVLQRALAFCPEWQTVVVDGNEGHASAARRYYLETAA